MSTKLTKAQLEAKIQQLTGTNQVLTTTIEGLRAENRELRTQYQNLSTELGNMKLKVSSLELANKILDMDGHRLATHADGKIEGLKEAFMLVVRDQSGRGNPSTHSNGVEENPLAALFDGLGMPGDFPDPSFFRS